MPFPLTDEQRKIVDDRGGELLVSAAAGSGKTRVLVERLLDRVTKEGIDIDRFLVITFTKAAAAELRGRIAQELSDRLAETPNDRHLRRQTTLVYKAQISTIHAFCSALLRESGHLLDLDPDFRLCDEGEHNVLMAQVLEEVLDRLALQGKTILLSTHLIEEVERFVGRAVLLKDGRVAGDMSVLELEERGSSLLEYVKETYGYRSDRVNRALGELTGGREI